MSAPEPADRPVLRVVRGDATPEELAALVAVLAAASGSPEPAATPPRVNAWVSRERAVGAGPRPGATAWRSGSLGR